MTKEQIKRALEIGEEEMCSPEMIEHCVFCREFMTPAMEALRKIEQLKRERDAAIEDLSGQCEYCLNEKDCVTRKGEHWDCWVWRGVRKEEQ